MRTLLPPVPGILCLAVMAVAISCQKHHEAPPIPADVETAVETQPPVQQPVTLNIDVSIQGYYCSLPYYYNYTSKRYPLLIFLPGAGQIGNGSTDLPLLLNDGVAKLVHNKTFPPNFTVNGENFSYIVLTPQYNRYPTVADIETFIHFARGKYRVDTARTYLSGISIGGELSADAAGTYPTQVAAIVSISGESKYHDLCTSIATNKIPVWDFHNSGDTIINISESNNFIAWINAANPAIPPKQTIFQSALHDAWTAALNPSYKEEGLNVYEWMLQYKK